MSAKAGKNKLGAGPGIYKLGTEGQGWEPGNANTPTDSTISTTSRPTSDTSGQTDATNRQTSTTSEIRVTRQVLS